MRNDLVERLEDIARFACIGDESSAAIAEAATALRALRDAPVGCVRHVDYKDAVLRLEVPNTAREGQRVRLVPLDTTADPPA